MAGVWTPGPGATANGDLYTGDASANIASGLGGGDSLFGLGGNDTLSGDEGADFINDDQGDVVSNPQLANDSDDTFNGGAGNDTLVGGLGSDSLNGGAGNDELIAGTASYVFGGGFIIRSLGSGSNMGPDTIDGGDGVDLAGLMFDYTAQPVVLSIANTAASNTIFVGGVAHGVLKNVESLFVLAGQGADSITGGVGEDTIQGFSGDDVLNGFDSRDDLSGGAGNDTIIGGVGDDFMHGDERYGAETGDDKLYGGVGEDNLSGGLGNDLLDGGAAFDYMDGGEGDDTYIVDNLDDGVVEAANAGADTVRASVDYVLGAEVENLVLTGAALINATGNELANALTGNSAANTLSGLAGADTLNGGAGFDTMIGGDGNDTYVVGSGGDVTTESSSAGGVDTVQSAVSRTLGANLENLTLIGTAVANATGNALNNIITGNSAKNILTGGLGADSFVLNTGPLNSTNRDVITDFNVAADTIRMENAIFAALGPQGVLQANRFYVGAAAHDADDRLIYDPGTGALIYDTNGNVAGGAVWVATLSTGLALTNADILVI